MFLTGYFLGLAITSAAVNGLLWLAHIAVKYVIDTNDVKGREKADKADPRGERYIRAFSSNIAMVTHFLLAVFGILEIVEFGQYETAFTSGKEYISIPLYLLALVSMFTMAVRIVCYYMQAGYVGQAQIEDLGEDMTWTVAVALVGSVILFFLPITSISNAIPVLFVFGTAAFGYVVFHTLRMHTIKISIWTLFPSFGFIVMITTNLLFFMLYHPHYDVLFRRLQWIPLIAFYAAATLSHPIQTGYEYFIERRHISGNKLRSTLGTTGMPVTSRETGVGYAPEPTSRGRTVMRQVSRSLFGAPITGQ